MPVAANGGRFGKEIGEDSPWYSDLPTAQGQVPPSGGNFKRTGSPGAGSGSGGKGGGEFLSGDEAVPLPEGTALGTAFPRLHPLTADSENIKTSGKTQRTNTARLPK